MYAPTTPNTIGAAVTVTDAPAVYKSSNFADGSEWSTISQGVGSAPPVLTPGAAEAPDKTMTATRAIFQSSPLVTGHSEAYSMLYKPGIAVTPGKFYTASIYMRRTPGAPSAALGLRLIPYPYSQLTPENTRTVRPGNSWQRFSLMSYVTPVGTQSIPFQLALWDAGQFKPPTSAFADVLIWGFRLDEGATPLGMSYGSVGGISPIALAGGLVAAWALFGDRR